MPLPYRSPFGPWRTTPTATRSPFPFTPPAVFADMPRIIRPTFSFPPQSCGWAWAVSLRKTGRQAQTCGVAGISASILIWVSPGGVCRSSWRAVANVVIVQQ